MERRGRRCVQARSEPSEPGEQNDADSPDAATAPEDDPASEEADVREDVDPVEDAEATERDDASLAAVDGAGLGAPDALPPEMDAAPQGATPDAGIDADTASEAGTIADAQTDDVNPPEPVLACPPASLRQWREFQTSDRRTSATLACYRSDPQCVTGACEMSGCLRSAAAVTGCAECAASEVACALENCAVQCGTSTADDACRACMCANGCMHAPGGCGLTPVDACADCVGASCSAGRAAASQVITVPVSFFLIQDSFDSSTGLPAYTNPAGGHETALAIDAELARVNSAFATVAPDDRRLRFVRAGMTYLPAVMPICFDPVALSDARRLYGGLNIVVGSWPADCEPSAPSAFAARGDVASLRRLLGNMMGIAPAEQSGQDWELNADQLTRMHNYARWRLGATDAVPEAGKARSVAFLHGPADPIWDKLTTRDWALNNASVFSATSSGDSTAAPTLRDFTVPRSGASRRVLGVRVTARITGSPSEHLTVTVRGPSTWLETAVIPRRAIQVDNGVLTVEEAFDSFSDPALLSSFRHAPAAGIWSVRLDDTFEAEVRVENLQLELVLGDRSFVTHDRHARGVNDLMVYRPSTSQLLTAMSSGQSSVGFGKPVADPVPPLPDALANVAAGDVDGDGQVDLIARAGATLWISLFKQRFGPWRSGAIAGSNLPLSTDEVLPGDFDGDGFADLMRRRPGAVEYGWSYHRGVGDGRFEAGQPIHISLSPSMLWTTSNYRVLGRSELVVRELDYRFMTVVQNMTPRPTTSGTVVSFWGAWNAYVDGALSVFAYTDRIVSIDANLDNFEDFLVRAADGRWSICYGAGGLFGARTPLLIGGQTGAFLEGDVVLNVVP